MPICWICQFSSYFAIRYVVHVSTLCSSHLKSTVQCNNHMQGFQPHPYSKLRFGNKNIMKWLPERWLWFPEMSWKSTL